MAFDGNVPLITNQIAADLLAINANWELIPKLSDADADTLIQVEESTDEDIIRFDTAGSQRMMINATGQVGIGKVPDSGVDLDVGDVASSGWAIIQADAGVADTSAVVRANGLTAGSGGVQGRIKAAAANTVYIGSESNTDVIFDAGGDNIMYLSDTHANVSINAAEVSAHYDLMLAGDGVLGLKETTEPTADTNYGKIYCKDDNKLYFQDGAGTEHTIAFA